MKDESINPKNISITKSKNLKLRKRRQSKSTRSKTNSMTSNNKQIFYDNKDINKEIKENKDIKNIKTFSEKLITNNNDKIKSRFDNKKDKEKEKEIYKGKDSYKDYKPLEENRYVNKLHRPGPKPPPSHIKMTTFFDYKPDLCKDYKETGYCGYGDTCKFVHDRTDYLSGWEIDRQWEKDQKNKNCFKEGDVDEGDETFLIKEDDKNEDEICPICKGDFVSPVLTICKHKFCDKCALEHYNKSVKCFVCRVDTRGIFNSFNFNSKRANRRKIQNDNTSHDKDFAKRNKGFNDESSWTYS